MERRLVLPVVLGVLLLGAIVYITRIRAELNALRDTTGQRAATAPAAPTRAMGGPRTLTDEQRRVMLEVLRSEIGPVRKVWFQVELNRAEPAAYQKALEEVFREAGWEIETHGSNGLVFKPGLYVLVGDDEWPSYASTVHEALERAGIEVKAARGYRAYYEEQKRERPDWQGPRLEDDQAYVVLVGPSPSP